MEQNERENARLYRVRKTLFQMLHDRGYAISQAEMEISLQEFLNLYVTGGIINREQLNGIFQKRDEPSEQLFVFFTEDVSVGVKPIRTYCEKMVEQNIHKAIVIYKQVMTPSASKVMAAMAPKYILEHFAEQELLVNITEHQLVPQHIPLNNEQKLALLKRYRLKETQLPRILINDPIAKYYGLRRGQVVKILRASETAGRYVTYRIVV